MILIKIKVEIIIAMVITIALTVYRVNYSITIVSTKLEKETFIFCHNHQCWSFLGHQLEKCIRYLKLNLEGNKSLIEKPI